MVKAAKIELRASPRTILGKKVSQLRRQGLIPANIYGHNVPSFAIQVPLDDLRHVLRDAGRNDIVYLEVDGGEPRPTFIRDVQRNPVSDAILHVDFLQISLKEKVRLEVPIHLMGVPGAVERLGGILVHGVDHVTVEALPTEVPSYIEVDVSGLEEFDQALHVSDLRPPPGVTILTEPELVVAKVAPPAVERAEEVEAGEEAAAAAAEEAKAEEGGE
jgi:large subunit ribosomal protein L25